MKPDTAAGGPPQRSDVVERAHLADPRDTTYALQRYTVPAEFAGLLQRFWIATWSVPDGQEAPQRVLQHPVCLLVVASGYARFYGVRPGLSTTTLTGRGWAVGLMCAPAAGLLVTGVPVAAWTDRSVDLAEVLGDAAPPLVARVRSAMADDPGSAGSHEAAMSAVLDALRPFLPVDPEGDLVNRVVAFVEARSDVLRVSQVCEEFSLPERALQRLAHRRLGLTPKWLIQRRRLQEAAERLRTSGDGLAEVAAVLGYADQPHFSRDFARVTGMTPGEFAARHAR